MRQDLKIHSTRTLLMGLLLAAASLTGCASSQRSGPQFTLISATCSPADRGPASPEIAQAIDDTIEPARLAFVPSFTATCRPDFEFSHLELALAFVDNRAPVAFDMMPLFGSTAAPGMHMTRRPAVIDVAANPSTPIEPTVSAEPDAVP